MSFSEEQLLNKNMITEKTTLDKILETKKGRSVLEKYDVPCLSCSMASKEIHLLKIGEVAKMYDLDIKNILKDLNN